MLEHNFIISIRLKRDIARRRFLVIDLRRDFSILDSCADNQQVSMSIEYQKHSMQDTVRGVIVHVRKIAFENVTYLGQIIIVNKRHK